MQDLITNTVIDSGLRISQRGDMQSHEQIREELIRQLDEGLVTGIDVAARLKVAPARVSEMKKRLRRVQPDEMAPLAEILGIADGRVPEGAMPTTAIPLLGEVPAGPWREAIRNSHHYIPAPQAGMPSSAYALTVSGDSMDRVVKDGATIIIDPTDIDLFSKRFFVVRNDDGEVTFKQYLEGPARLVPCSRNPEHKEIPVTDRTYEILGRVIKIILDPDQAALA